LGPRKKNELEIDGHPTQDLIEELERRGAVRVDGTSEGPQSESVRFISERLEDKAGSWLFLPNNAFLTGFDDVPS
jgi:hypothetical protein